MPVRTLYYNFRVFLHKSNWKLLEVIYQKRFGKQIKLPRYQGRALLGVFFFICKILLLNQPINKSSIHRRCVFKNFTKITGKHQCVKSIQIRRFFWSVFCRIHTEYGEILSRSAPVSKSLCS